MKKLLQFGLLSGLILLCTSVTGCPVWQLTGIPCPACGMTRAWISLVKGQLAEAFAWHPLFWMAPWILYLMYRDFAGGIQPGKQRRQNIQLIGTAVFLLAIYIERIWLYPHGPVQITWQHGWIERIYSCLTVLRGK